MSDHLTPEDFFEFIDQGSGRGGMGHHLMDCPECLFELDFLLLAEAPATPEEEAALDLLLRRRGRLTKFGLGNLPLDKNGVFLITFADRTANRRS